MAWYLVKEKENFTFTLLYFTSLSLTTRLIILNLEQNLIREYLSV
jgi:hypothetical protein